MIDLNEIVSAVNEAPSGSFIGITDYVSEKGDVSSVTGQIGVSYGTAKERALKALETAIEAKDFEAMEVKGICRTGPDGELNSRKRSWDMKPFVRKYSQAQVIAIAVEVMESYRDSIKKSNKVELSEKEDGCYLESETDNINIRLLVQRQTYKELESLAAKANLGKVDKPKATMPDSLVKKAIRKRFEPKIKSFTIRSDNFAKLTIAGHSFE